MIDWIIAYTVLILAVMLIRFLFKGKISKRLQYGLWLLVAVRLLIPGNIGTSSFSVEHLTNRLVDKSEPYVAGEVYSDNATDNADRNTFGEPDSNGQKAELALGNEEVQRYDSVARAEEQSLKLQENKGNMAQGHLDRKEEEGLGSAGKIPESTKPEGISELLLAERNALETDESKQMSGEMAKASILPALLSKAVTVIWVAGMFIMGMVFMRANRIFHKKVKANRKAVPVVYTKLPVYTTDMVETPCLFGVSKPQIYVTKDVIEDNTMLRHTIYHEMTHYMHGDLLWSLVRIICLILHWYNPIVWWAAALSRQDGELACDEGTILRLGEKERKEYGKTLIQLTCRKSHTLFAASTTMSAGKRDLRERIRQIGKRSKNRFYAMVLVLVLLVSTAGCTFTEAGTPKEAASNEESVTEAIVQTQENRGVSSSVEEMSKVESSKSTVTAKKVEQEERYDERGRRIITLYSDAYSLEAVKWLYEAFNESSQEYKIEPVDNQGNLLLSVANTKQCPDLVLEDDWREIGYWQEKGYLADLAPYLEESQTLNRENLREKVLEQFTIEDGLYALPRYVGLETILAPKSRLGGITQWTAEEFLDWLENNPQADFTMGPVNGRAILEYCLFGELEKYVDLEQGSAEFTIEGFGELLTRIKSLKIQEMGYVAFPEIESEEICLITHYLNTGRNISHLEGVLEDTLVPIGYPSDGGAVKCNLVPVENFAIMENSRCKEGAFAFMEFCLTYDETDKEIMESAEWYDGMLWTVESRGGSNLNLPYDTYVNYFSSEGGTETSVRQEYTMTQENEDMFQELYEGAQPDSHEKQHIRRIILEVADDHFRFNKPLKKTCDEIQNQVMDYLKKRNS